MLHSIVKLGVGLLLFTHANAQYWSGTPSCAVQCLDAAARSAGCTKGDIECMCDAQRSSASTTDDASLKSCVRTYCSASDAQNLLTIVSNFKTSCSAEKSSSETTTTTKSTASADSSTTSETTDTSNGPTEAATLVSSSSSSQTTTTTTPAPPPRTEAASVFTNIPIAPPPKSAASGPAGGTIAGIVVACIGSIAMVTGIALWYFRRRRNRQAYGGDGKSRLGGAGAFRWPQSRLWSLGARRGRLGRPQHFRKLSNSSSKYFDSPSGSPEPDEFPEMMKGKQSAYETVLPLGNRTSVESTRPLSTVTYVPPRKPIPIKGILRAMSPVDESKEWNEEKVMTAPTIHRSLSKSNSVRKAGHVDIASVNRAFDNTYSSNASMHTRPASSSTVSDMSLFMGPVSPSTPAQDSFLRPMPNHRDCDSTAAGAEVSRFSIDSDATRMSGIAPIRMMRNSSMSIGERLSTQPKINHHVSQLSVPLSTSGLSSVSRIQSGVSLASEDGLRTELARMTLGYMPYPPSMPGSPPPIPTSYLDGLGATGGSSSNHNGHLSSVTLAGRKSVSASLGHKSITPSLAAEEDRRAAEREAGRSGTPGNDGHTDGGGAPRESMFSDDGIVLTPRSDAGGFREPIRSPVLKMASVQEATRAKLVTVKSKTRDDGASSRSSEEGGQRSPGAAAAASGE